MDTLNLVNQLLGTAYSTEEEAQKDLIQEKAVTDYHSAEVRFLVLQDNLLGNNLKGELAKRAHSFVMDVVDKPYLNSSVSHFMLSTPVEIINKWEKCVRGVYNLPKRLLDLTMTSYTTMSIEEEMARTFDKLMHYKGYIDNYVLTDKAKELAKEQARNYLYSKLTLDINNNKIDIDIKYGNILNAILGLIKTKPTDNDNWLNTYQTNYLKRILKSSIRRNDDGLVHTDTKEFNNNLITSIKKEYETYFKEDNNNNFDNYDKVTYIKLLRLLEWAVENRDAEILDRLSYLFKIRNTLLFLL